MKITEVAVNTQGLTVEQANHLFDIVEKNGYETYQRKQILSDLNNLELYFRKSATSDDFGFFFFSNSNNEITYSQFVELFYVKAEPTLEEIDAQIKALEEKKKELELKNRKFGVFWDDDDAENFGIFCLGTLTKESDDGLFIDEQGFKYGNFIELDLDQNPQLKEIVSKFI